MGKLKIETIWIFVILCIMGSKSYALDEGYSEKFLNSYSSYLDVIAQNAPESLPQSEDERLNMFDTLQSMYVELNGSNTAGPSLDELLNFMREIPNQKLIDRDSAQKIAQFLIARTTNADYAELHGGLIMLLHPFVLEAGGCVDDPEYPGAVLCQFSSGSQGVSSIASFSDTDIGLNFISETPPEGSDLEHILQPVKVNCHGGASRTSNTSSTNQTTDLLVDGNCASYQYGSTYGYRYKVEWHGETRVWAEVFGVATLGLQTSIADTVFVDLPLALYCGWKCWGTVFSSCLSKITSGKTEEALECAARKASKRNYTLHGNNSYIQHVHAKSCNVLQANPEDRDYFRNYQAGNYDDMYQIPDEAKGFVGKDDLKFQTHYQYPSNDIDISSNGRNMFPLPTEADVPLVLAGHDLPSWKHQFSAIKGWKFNIIYGAADALINSDVLVGNYCSREYKHPDKPSLVAYGDQFQVYHGTKASLPEWNLLVGFNSYHPAHACTTLLMD